MRHFPETVCVYQRKSALAVCHERWRWWDYLQYHTQEWDKTEALHSCKPQQTKAQRGVLQHEASWFQNSHHVHQARWLSAGPLQAAHPHSASPPLFGWGSTPLGRLFFGLDLVREGAWYPFWHPRASSSLQTWSHFGRTQWDCCWLLGARRLGAHWGWGKEEYWVPRGGTNMVSEWKTSAEERGEHLFLETSGHGCELCLRGSQHVY